MSDLIDRQALIADIDKLLPVDPLRDDYTQGRTTGLALAMERIKNAPSALSTNLASLGTDCISRQAAIDAVCAVCGNACDKSKFVYNAPQDEQVIICPEHYCLCTLPSAQPDIIRCKDCKHHWTHKCMDSMPIERCDLEQTFYDAEHDFCSLAERREDG